MFATQVTFTGGLVEWIAKTLSILSNEQYYTGTVDVSFVTNCLKNAGTQ